MANSFQFNAELRTGSGSSAARALRREGKVPAVLYGSSDEPLMLSLIHKDLVKNLENEAVYSHLLDVQVDGRVEHAILKGVQRHPSRPVIMHVDFQRVSASEKIKVHVPLHFVGEEVCEGVKKGGVVMHNAVDVEIACLPTQLPEYLVVDVSAMGLGDSLHLSDVVVPEGVEITALLQGEDHDLPVVTVQATRAEVSAESEE